jgi:hypothetical protein
MYYITWVFQYLTILLGNMGFILLGGKALKVLLISNIVCIEQAWKLPVFVY